MPESQPERTHITRYADISEDGVYRYHLRRVWDPSVHGLAFVMLNPSTADGEKDDPTIRRCIRFARDFGFGGMYVVNLYAFRATKPADLWKASDPVGPENDSYLRRTFVAAAAAGKPVIAAWGANARPDRVAQVLDLPLARESLHALGLTKDGAPRHPLYMPASARPVTYPPAAVLDDEVIGLLAPRCPRCGWQAIDRPYTEANRVEQEAAATADVVDHNGNCPAGGES